MNHSFSTEDSRLENFITNLPSMFDGVTYPNVVAFMLSLLTSYIFVTAVHRLYFHPLSKYPGPFWAKLTTFPSWWHAKEQDRHIWFLSLQEKYGTVVRIRPDEVLMNTPTAFSQIYGSKSNVTKSDYHKPWPRAADTVNTWSSISKAKHAQKRRILNYAFSEAALKTAETFLHSNLNRWLYLLGDTKRQEDDSEWTESINIEHHVNYLVFDILGDLCFGKNFDMKEPESDLRNVPDIAASYMGFMHQLASSPICSTWSWLKPRGLDKLLVLATPPAIKSWDDFLKTCLIDRTNMQKELQKNPKPESETRQDFFHWLFQAKVPQNGAEYSELFQETELLTIAGSDTTALVTSAMFFYLCWNKDIQDRLAHEVLSTFDSYDEIKGGAKLQSCGYLTACIQEGLRMAPPVGGEMSRVVLHGGMTIDGHFLPPGSLVGTASWPMHYNPSHYSEPLKFRPERWIVGEGDSTEESVALAESALITFSTGPRGCVGKNLAWLEMRIALAKFIWKFEMRRDPNNNLGGGSPNEKPGRQVESQYQTWDVYVANRKGPMVQLKERVH